MTTNNKPAIKTMLKRSDQPNIASLNPCKYPWANRIYDLMTDNLWTPTVINMSDDIAHFRELSEPERRAYTHTLAYLNTADITAMENINQAIAARLSAPELECLYSHIVYQEANHSKSYLYMLESLDFTLSEQQRLFELYLHEPALRDKIEMSRKWTANLVKLPVEDLTDDEIKTFIHGYFYFTQVFEGTMFLAGFNPIYSLCRRRKMLHSKTMLYYIRRDEASCHVTAGRAAIREIMKEHPNVSLDADLVKEMFTEAYELEKNYIEFIMPDGLPGYSKEDHLQQFRAYANKVCRHFRIPMVFEQSSDIDWITRITSKTLTNFFENRVTSYAVGTNIRSTFTKHKR